MDSKKNDDKGHKTTRSVNEKHSANKSKGSNSDQENRTGRGNKKDSDNRPRNG